MGLELVLADGSRDRLSRQLHIYGLLVLLALAALAHRNLIEAAIKVWIISPTYSHCFFILPVSAFLIWRKREQISRCALIAEPRALFGAFPILLIQLAALLAGITELQQLALIALIQILTLALLGTQIYRIILFPMLYLFFLVPMGEYLVQPLQDFTTRFISVGLTLFGILHHTEGTVVELVNGTYRVAEACAGLRFLIATIAIGALFCYLSYRSWYKSALFMAACAFVPIIANGIRALGIVLIAHFSNNKIATGADHLIYGWGFSVLILTILIWIGVGFSDSWQEEPPHSYGASHRDRLALTLIISLVILSSVPAIAYWDNHRPLQFDRSALVPPKYLGAWKEMAPKPLWAPSYSNADASMQFALQLAPSSPPVETNVLYYADGQRLVSSVNSLWAEDRWRLVSENQKQLVLDHKHIIVQQLLLKGSIADVMVWWTFWDRAGFTTSRLKIKLDSVTGRFVGSSGSALVAMSTLVDGDPDQASKRLENAISLLHSLPGILDRTAFTRH